MRIAILDKNDAVLAFMDNSLPGAMHFYDDVLHNYLEGTASSFEFSTVPHEDSEYLIEGNHLSFRHGKRDYYFNIISVERSEFVVTVTAYALVFDLLNEQIGPYSAQSAMSFAEYLNVFGLADVLTIGLNEVSTKRITHEWTGTDTALKRLYSLAEIFGAELEFASKLNENFTLHGIVLDIYSKHTSTNQGMLDIFSHRDNGQLILTAKLLDGMKDVTKKYPESNFAWYEVKTTELEKVGNGYSYTAADEKTIYRCIYSDEEG